MTPPEETTPDDLKGIVEVLEKSLHPSKEEQVPPLPDDLRERLRERFAKQKGLVEPSAKGWVSRVWEVLSQPVFSGAFAALVLLGIVGGLMLKDGSVAPEQMRGGAPAEIEDHQTVLILFGLDEAQQEALIASGYFEESLMQVAADDEKLAELVAKEGASLVIDGQAGELKHEDGRKIALPAESTQIADAVLDFLAK